MSTLLHLSPNEFPDLEIDHSTKKIWIELAKGFDEYHILARAKDNKFYYFKEGNIFLHLIPKFGRSRSFFFTSIFMLKIISKYKVNVILTQCPISGGFIASIISKIIDIPIMVEIHGMEYFRILDSKNIFDKILAKMIRFSLKNANKVRMLSTKMTELLTVRNINTNNIVVIPNRVNCKLFNYPKKNNQLHHRIQIVSIGRFVWEKGYNIAIEAIKELHNIFDIELTLIGGGPLIETYKNLSSGCEYISFIDRLPQEELVPFLNQSDIYIQPSISEGMPRTILEAMAIKLPVIASNVGAISGIIEHRKNGILIEAGNVESLISSIKEMIQNHQLRENIALNGYIDVTTKYEWNKVFDKYRSELIDLIY